MALRLQALVSSERLSVTHFKDMRNYCTLHVLARASAGLDVVRTTTLTTIVASLSQSMQTALLDQKCCSDVTHCMPLPQGPYAAVHLRHLEGACTMFAGYQFETGPVQSAVERMCNITPPLVTHVLQSHGLTGSEQVYVATDGQMPHNEAMFE